MFIEWSTFWPSFIAALIGTLKVFAMGMAGFYFARRGWIDAGGMRVLGVLVAQLTMPCLIFYRFATRFDPDTFPDWWKYVLIGLFVTVAGMLLGKIVALRHGNNDEATLLVGFQNAGFFVLPMLQALLPDKEYSRGALMLFVLIVPFNASLWFCGSWFLLHKKTFNPRVILTAPFVATVGSLLLYGLLHDWVHGFNDTLPMRVLFGDATPGGDVGAMQLIGDLTVPLATILLGASVADSLRGPLSNIEGKRAALEVTFVKMILYPLLGFLLLRWASTHLAWPMLNDPVVQLLVMLQFASPPAIALSVFSQQNGYNMKFIPLTCLISYIVCLFSVPFWVALVLKPTP
jgi:predicted permease